MIESFKGDAEKFYPAFYKCVSDNADVIFQGLSRDCSLLLGFEVSNHVLTHLSGATHNDNILSLSNNEPTKFSLVSKTMLVNSYILFKIARRQSRHALFLHKIFLKFKNCNLKYTIVNSSCWSGRQG